MAEEEEASGVGEGEAVEGDGGERGGEVGESEEGDGGDEAGDEGEGVEGLHGGCGCRCPWVFRERG